MIVVGSKDSTNHASRYFLKEKLKLKYVMNPSLKDLKKEQDIPARYNLDDDSGENKAFKMLWKQTGISIT